MKNALRWACQDLRRFLQLDEAKRQQFLYAPATSFTRCRQLTFERTAALVLSLLKKTLSIELFDFFRALKLNTTTKSAFIQARRKLKAAFFTSFFLHTAQVFYRRFPAKRWKSFRLWACDGTGLRLPNEPWVGDAFGWHQNQHSRVPSTRLLCYYDVLNKIIVKVALHPREFAEVTMACPAIKDIPKDVIVIYDRGFASYAVLFLHMFYGSNCIIRLKKDFNPTVVAFLQSKAPEMLVETPMPERATRCLRKLGHKVSRKDTIRYRLIRVELPNGEVEVLMTSLLHRRRYHRRHFAGLYNSRWGVETCFHILKSYFQAAVFASYTNESIRQEVWAMFALFNLQSMCQFALEKQVGQKTQGRKYAYQLNRNAGLGYLKRFLPALLLDGPKRWWARVKELLALLLSALEPIRPDKTRVRKRRLMRGAERHNYESNYKPSL